MDFYRIKERSGRNGVIEIYPDFKVVRSKDLMVQGKSFYAIWDDEAGLWSTDEYDVQRLVDADLMRYKDELGKKTEGILQAKLMGDFSSNSWLQWRSYVSHISDSSHQLDNDLTFSNTDVKKTDYVSKRLPYPLEKGDCSAWDELIGTLYDPTERAKLEWAIGAVVAGDAKDIQKFLVLYGSAGTGKSTILNIIQKLFVGYYTTFEAKALTSTSNAFSTEVFKSNPLVAIQHDGDLSKIEDNTKLNSIISHEDMTLNEKYKPSYMSRINAFLFMGTNSPVKITDSKSGIIRRLIDVQPTGNKLPPRRYQSLMSQIDFELGAIAYHCLETYREMGKDFYSSYRPVEMMLQTDVFYNFIEDGYDVFKSQDGTTLHQAYEMYKQFCEQSLIDYKLPKHKFREELKNYFGHFEERAVVDGTRVRSWYSTFLTDKFKVQIKEEDAFPLVLDEDTSIFDEEWANQPAQYAKEDGTPEKYWSDRERMINGVLKKPRANQIVSTTLADLDTSKEHYVKLPENHIVIDFDLKGDTGEKSTERNLEAASNWPPTYAEFSKSGSGIHLHYIYEGDASELSRVYSDGIEIKVFTGDSSLRRRLSKCNNVPIAQINSGLPLKEKKKVINSEVVQTERSIRDLIERNLRKEIHGATKPSVDFIHKILEEAYSSGLTYDVTDLRAKIITFAAKSTNQREACLRLVGTMKFASEETEPEVVAKPDDESHIVFFDCEVFPNLFVICWKIIGEGRKVVRMINPSPREVEELMTMSLVGYNCRQYDNHILYAASMGYNNEQLYKLSKRLINNEPAARFREAYEVSYTDIYDFLSIKKSLKLWQIDLGIPHKELGLPWDEPVPEELWNKVAEYCDNDVISEEVVFEARREDFVARKILADLSGLSVNATTARHTAQIVFEGDKNAKEKFVYTDLSEMFPGYEYSYGKSSYKGKDPGEGGYVDAIPGIYYNVGVLDVASMHPTSIEELELFGTYTKNYSALKKARIAIKHGDFDSARRMLDGKLAPYLKSEDQAEALSYALKIVINIVYGLTAASFPNAFRDDRNKDNIVAKRGALFMIDLQEALEEKGWTPIHIKTDSVKIADITPEIIEFVMEFGMEYGYIFEHEATYEKFCLLNDAVYAAKTIDGRSPAHWTATGAQFIHPYVFKRLFSKEDILFEDLCETKQVKTALYLSMDEDVEENDTPMVFEKDTLRFVGKTGSFCPIKPGHGGGRLLREGSEGKFTSATGAKGYRWLESDIVEGLGKQDSIDMEYFEGLADKAKAAIEKFGDAEAFIA